MQMPSRIWGKFFPPRKCSREAGGGSSFFRQVFLLNRFSKILFIGEGLYAYLRIRLQKLRSRFRSSGERVIETQMPQVRRQKIGKTAFRFCPPRQVRRTADAADGSFAVRHMQRPARPRSVRHARQVLSGCLTATIFPAP